MANRVSPSQVGNAVRRRTFNLLVRRSLPRLWADSGPDGRQALVVAIFARLDVLGFQRLEYELTPDAIDLGLNAALPAVLELESKIGEFGRGERSRPDTLRVNVRIASKHFEPARGRSA